MKNIGKDIKPENRILIEIGKIKGNLRILWDLSKAEKLERNRCLNSIREIDKSLAIIVSLFKNSVVKRLLANAGPENLLLADIITKAFGGKGIDDVLEQGLSTVERTLLPYDLSYLPHYIENPQTYDDKNVKSSIVNFCKDLEKKIVLLEDEFGVESELLLLAGFSSLFPTFTSNWIVATIYLTAMEISVKGELTQRGKEIKDKFKENFQLLLSCLKDEIEISELEKLLPPLFWDIRNKVIHEGYSPTDEELKIIGEYVIKLMSKL